MNHFSGLITVDAIFLRHQFLSDVESREMLQKDNVLPHWVFQAPYGWRGKAEFQYLKQFSVVLLPDDSFAGQMQMEVNDY